MQDEAKTLLAESTDKNRFELPHYIIRFSFVLFSLSFFSSLSHLSLSLCPKRYEFFSKATQIDRIQRDLEVIADVLR
jgi:hypothetical protein